jgi:hypothetical protein
MPELSAIEMQDRELTTAGSSRAVDHALKFFSGALFTAALVAAGAVLVTVALTVGVVVAPVIALALGFWALQRREAPRAAARTVDC